jgi:hypothetical protein
MSTCPLGFDCYGMTGMAPLQCPNLNTCYRDRHFAMISGAPLPTRPALQIDRNLPLSLPLPYTYDTASHVLRIIRVPSEARQDYAEAQRLPYRYDPIRRILFVDAVTEETSGHFAEAVPLPYTEYCETRQAYQFDLPYACVAGYQHYDGGRIAAQLRAGDRLILRRQPENEYDEAAIEIFTETGIKLGYVARNSNQPMAMLMDRGQRLEAEILELDPAASVAHRLAFQVWMLA